MIDLRSDRIRRPAVSADALCAAVFFLSVIAILALFYWLPVFPSGDGGGHLYYSHVLGQLLEKPGFYAQYFAPRRVIGPYAIHYFALIWMQKLVAVNTAEKIFAILTILNIALGFYFLSQKLGRNEKATAVWAVPLLLPWCMLGGFMNFAFSAGVALWALGCWYAARGSRPRLAFSGFLACIGLLLLSHPVPLLMLCFVTGVDLGLILVERVRVKAAPIRGLAPTLLCMAAESVALVVPVLIADKSQVAADAHRFGLHLTVIRDCLLANNLSMLRDFAHTHGMYRVLLAAMLPMAVILILRGVQGRWRMKALRNNDRLTVALILLVCITFVIPEHINNGGYFPNRMWWPCWLMAVAGLAGVELSKGSRTTLNVAGIALAVVTLVGAFQVFPPLARQYAIVDAVTLPKEQRGLFVESYQTYTYYAGTSYHSFLWSGGRAFSHSDDLMLNSPWLDTTILPVKAQATPELLIHERNLKKLDPFELIPELQANPALRDKILGETDFVFYIDPGEKHPNPSAEVAGLFSGARDRWTCRTGTIYAVCQKSQPAGQTSVGS